MSKYEHQLDLEEWNEETEWEWGFPLTHQMPGWGWSVTHPFSTRADGATEKEYGVVFAVYKDMTLRERKALFVLDGGHMSQDQGLHRGWTFDYWQHSGK